MRAGEGETKINYLVEWFFKIVEKRIKIYKVEWKLKIIKKELGKAKISKNIDL